VSLEVGQTALQQYVRVEADDGVDAGGLIAGENDAGQHKGNEVFTPQQRLFDLGSG